MNRVSILDITVYINLLKVVRQEGIVSESRCVWCKFRFECEWVDDLNFQYCPEEERGFLDGLLE